MKLKEYKIQDIVKPVKVLEHQANETRRKVGCRDIDMDSYTIFIFTKTLFFKDVSYLKKNALSSYY